MIFPGGNTPKSPEDVPDARPEDVPEVQPEDVPEQQSASASLLDAVTDLRRDVEATRLPLPLPGGSRAAELRAQLLDQLDDHLLPRLRRLSAPALVVVAGSTGAGKSTLVNTLLREEISPAGVLRPTTRHAVLAHHPAEGRLLAAHPLLDLVQVVPHPAVPRGMALIDAPDLDSLLASNRQAAHRLLEAADLWLFMTTAARYGDALPWQVLQQAVARGASLAMVLNRVPPEAAQEVRTDLLFRLRAHDMADVPLFLIPDLGPHQGMLPLDQVVKIERWLELVAGPDRGRAVIARTQRGALAALRPWANELSDLVQEQVDARIELQAALEEVVAKVATGTRTRVREGGIARGPLTARWSVLTAGPLAGPWGSRRGRKARQRALVELVGELRREVALAVQATREAARQGASQITGPGAQPLIEALSPAATSESVVAGWLAHADGEVDQLRNSTRRAGRGLRRLLRSVGADGTAALLSLAAAGVGPARDAVTAALGPEVSDAVVGGLRDELADLVAGQAERGVAPAAELLRRPELSDDAAAQLRLRLAVLKRLV